MSFSRIILTVYSHSLVQHRKFWPSAIFKPQKNFEKRRPSAKFNPSKVSDYTHHDKYLSLNGKQLKPPPILGKLYKRNETPWQLLVQEIQHVVAVVAAVVVVACKDWNSLATISRCMMCIGNGLWSYKLPCKWNHQTTSKYHKGMTDASHN